MSPRSSVARRGETPPEGGKLQSFVTLLGNAITLLVNPVITGGDTGDDSTVNRIVGIIRLGQSLLVQADAGYEEMEALNARIQVLVDEQRAPTEEEWQEIQQHRQSNDERLEKAAAENQ